MALSFVISQAGRTRFFELLSVLPTWVLFGLIVVAFLVFGLRDIARLSWARISAISSVSFDESIRRRVLWVTPLAILGAVVVSQLQNAVDPQDAIRQTTKICLFATGLVVTLVAIILASTNLQKEIETRVIYTIVTKPTTRLEIVLGKVWGFAKVSAAILLIMGVFTYAYLHLRAWKLSGVIAGTLQTLPADAVNRQTLEYYRDAGLLNAKAMSEPARLELLARPPVEGQPRWIAGGQGQSFAVKYTLTPEQLPAVAEAIKTGGRVELRVHTPVTVREASPLEMEVIRMTNIPLEEQPGAQTAPTTASTTKPTTTATTTTAPTDEPKTGRAVPMLLVSFRTADGDPLIGPEQINRNAPLRVPGDGSEPVALVLTPEQLDKLFDTGTFIIAVEGRSPGVEYAVGDRPVTMHALHGDGSTAATFEPPSDFGPPSISGSTGRYGQQLVGGPEGYGGLAVFEFKGLSKSAAAAAPDARFTFEVKTGIERGGDSTGDVETLPEATLRIYDPKTGAASQPIPFRPETNRLSYVSVPRSALPADGGRFDVLVRVLTPDQWLGVSPQSVVLATASHSFPVNLFKSLLILWLMSVLVIAIALFCSTFVSWPIAVVLTLMILLGRWGFEQIGDAGGGGLGAMMTGQTDDAVKARIGRTVIDTLGKTLAVIAAFLPDIGGFQPTADIERGISVPLSRLGSAGWVLLGYGLPMVVLAYLILKRKEVAP